MAPIFPKTKVHDSSCEKTDDKDDIISANGEKIQDFLVKILSNILNARVKLERLPEDIVTKYMGMDKIGVSETSGKNENKCRQGNNVMYDVICSKCNSKGKHFYGTVDAKCKKCKNRLVYHCRKCGGKFRTRSIVKYHLMTTCNPKGFYHCLKCGYKSVWKMPVKDTTLKIQTIVQNILFSKCNEQN